MPADEAITDTVLNRPQRISEFGFPCPDRANEGRGGAVEIVSQVVLSSVGPGMEFTGEIPTDESLLKLAAGGDSDALGQLLESHRQRLEHIVRFRLDHRLQSRMNVSDVIQETYLEAGDRLREYLANPEVPFFIWLRFLTQQRVQLLHRHHLGRQLRDANRERSIDDPGSEGPMGTGVIAAHLASRFSSVSSTLQREELRQRLHELLDQLDAVDREILVLRHFEQLTNAECAQILGLSVKAASNRYVRALERLREQIGDEEDLNAR